MITPAPDDMRVFVRVARLASFTKAAQQLDMPRATVSTAIRRLETLLALPLLHRTTRRVILTQDGELFLERCERILADLEELGSLFAMKSRPLQGHLRVEVPLGMATGLVMAHLPEFLKLHPELSIDLNSSDRRVDLLSENVDCVVRVGAVIDESLACRPLGMLPLLSVASRSYVLANGLPRTLDDLESHWSVRYAPDSAYVAGPATFDYVDPLSGNLARRPMRHRVSVNNSAAYNAACRAGFGIVQVPSAGVAAGLKSGDLIQILPHYAPLAMPVNLLFPAHRQLPARLRAFADWLVTIFT